MGWSILHSSSQGTSLSETHGGLGKSVILPSKWPSLLSVFHPCFDEIQTITEICPFVSQEGTEVEQDIFSAEKVMILHAFLGRGKTTTIKRLVEGNGFQRVLFLSPRVAFFKFVANEFDAAYHLNGNLSADCLVCSMEGLHRIMKQSYDLVVLDECEANSGVFSSPTMRGNVCKNWFVLMSLIHEAKKVIFTGAFITDKKTVFVRSLNLPAVRIHNTTPQTRRLAVYHKGSLIKPLLDTIRNGKKPFVVWNAKSHLKEFDPLLYHVAPDVHGKQLVYCSDVDDKVYDTLENIHESWTGASLVQTTPSIAVGNSYAPGTPSSPCRSRHTQAASLQTHSRRTCVCVTS